MKVKALVLILLACAGAAFSGWDMIWNDEFEYEGLPDSSKWGYDVGTGSNGWGNSELEYYTKDSLKNARVENGTLIITAMKEKIAQSNYTSARLVTKNKGDWLYGRFEVAAKVPKGVGLWPAIWMLPTDWEYGGWPASGELDIMENVGFDSMRVHFNIHTEAYNHSIGTNKGAVVDLDDPHTTFNVYALEWYEDSVVFFVNNTRTFMFKNEYADYKTWPFDKRFHLLLNIAVGGSWGGQQGVDDEAMPGSMVVDYVRVYKENSTAVSSVPGFHTHRRLNVALWNEVLTVSGGTNGKIRLYSLDGTPVFSSAVKKGRAVRRFPAGLPAGIYAAEVHTETGVFRLPFGGIR